MNAALAVPSGRTLHEHSHADCVPLACGIVREHGAVYPVVGNFRSRPKIYEHAAALVVRAGCDSARAFNVKYSYVQRARSGSLIDAPSVLWNVGDTNAVDLASAKGGTANDAIERDVILAAKIEPRRSVRRTRHVERHRPAAGN